MPTDTSQLASDSTLAQRVVEKIAQQWDECFYDSAGMGEIDIGQAIRTAGESLLREEEARTLSAAQHAPGATAISSAIDPVSRGWLAALSDAFHNLASNAPGRDHTRAKLQELLAHLATQSPTPAPDAHALARTLRDQGYAVAIFNPDELEGVDPRRLEDRLVHEGNEAIPMLRAIFRERGRA